MAAKRDSEHFYVWETPGKPITVRIDLGVVDRLGSSVKAGFNSIPGRGLETGGLLLGHTRRQAGGIVTQIEDFEPVECEHVVGPSYLLSPADRKILEERIAWRKSGAGRLNVVGFYRGHTRKEVGIAVEDVDLFSACFGKSSDVFLLLKSNGAAPPTAGFIIWEGGKIRSQKPCLEFPFDKAALLSGGHRVDAVPASGLPAQSPVGSGEPAPPRAVCLPGLTTLLRSIPRMRFAWTWAGIALLLGAGFIASVRHGETKPPIVPDALSLRVSREGAALRLGWDRASTAIKTARRAVLWIDDGAVRQKLDLDAAHLSSGSIAYWPKSADVTFRLEVAAPSFVASESFRSIGAPPAPVAAVAETETAPPRMPDPDPLTVAVAHAVSPAAFRPAFNRHRGWADRRLTPKRAIRRFTPPPLAISGAPEPVMPVAPPEVAPAGLGPYAVEVAPALDRIAEPRQPAIPNPFLRIAVEPVSTSPSGLRSVGLGMFGRRRNSEFVPPTPIRQSQPEIPAALRARITRVIPVAVKVYVSPSGAVDYAELLSNGTGANRELASLAVFSARRWEFVPARLDGHNVAGEVILRFRFGLERP